MCKKLIIATLLLLNACSARREDDGRTQGARNRPVEISGITADSFLVISRTIDLETTSESLIAFPFDLCVDGEEIFVASRNNEIKVFNMAGKYQRNIGRLGDGPGEYRAISSLFPHGSDAIGVYDWSNLRLTVFSRKGEYRMSAVLGIPGMEGVRSVLFINGFYYLHVPSSPAQNCHVVKMDTNLAMAGGYVEADRHYMGYEDRLLFNGGIVMDTKSNRIYEADSYSPAIRCIDPVGGTVRELDLDPPSFYVSMPPLPAPTSMDEALALFQQGTNVYNIFLAGGQYLMLEYHVGEGHGRVKVVYLFFDLRSGRCFTVPAGRAHPSYADGEHLYALLYHEKNSKQTGDMVSNPSLVVYSLSIKGQ